MYKVKSEGEDDDMRTRLFSAITALLVLLVLTSCGQKQIKNGMDFPIKENFVYTDQNGEELGLKDLKGKVWVSDFMFTSCEDVCLPMTANMVKLQQMVKDEGLENVEFVSFSVDPAVDTPETLKKFGEQFNVDFKNWHFLTGYSQEEIENFALKNYQALVKKPESQDQVIHGTSFYLIDKNGHIQKDYTGLNDIPFEEIVNDIKTLE